MSLDHHVVVLDTDEPREPCEEDVKEYAAFLGIDVDTEPHLMWIAWEGVAAPVPAPWKACHNLDAENEDEIFYFNFETAESVWDHPCDEKYKDLVEEARAEFKATGSVTKRSLLQTPVSASLRLEGPSDAPLTNIQEEDESVSSSASSADEILDSTPSNSKNIPQPDQVATALTRQSQENNSLHEQLESLARSLAMLKEIRCKQQEYLRLLQSSV